MLKLYAYQGCSTCRAAVKWLRRHDIPFDEIAIRETPPPVSELRAMLEASGGNLRSLFNTSGQDYRALGLKDKLSALTTDAALDLLAGNGNLIRRPFAIDTNRGIRLTGFKEPEWLKAFEI